jgi:hypothetical protein
MRDLAWRQLKLEGKYDGTLDAFRASLVDIDPIVASDPT